MMTAATTMRISANVANTNAKVPAHSTATSSAVDALLRAANAVRAFVTDAFEHLRDCCVQFVKPTPNKAAPTAAPGASAATGSDDASPVFEAVELTPLSAIAADALSVATASIIAPSLSVAPSTAPTRRPSTSRSSWSGMTVFEPVIEPTTSSSSSSTQHPVPDVDDLLLPPMLSRTTPFAREAHRRRFAANTRLQARIAAQRIRQAAAQHRDEPAHEDAPQYACSCGFCPNETAAYDLCAAVTLRRMMRSFGARATTSTASATAQRQNACFRRAACVFTPARH